MIDFPQFSTVKIETLTFKLNDPSPSFPPKIKDKRSIALMEMFSMTAMKLVIKLFSLAIFV